MALLLELQSPLQPGAYIFALPGVPVRPDCGVEIACSGVLEFTTKGGETLTILPGDVLAPVDHAGTEHKWRLLNDDPWRRACVVFAPGADTQFIPD